MSKDHTPGGFHRTVDYRSDLEIAETGPMVKSVNTSFGSGSHNAYIMRKDGTHEHFYYSPETGKSGWHGNNWETKNNHPPKPTETETKETKAMDRNEFLESIKVDKATIEQCDEAGRKAAQNKDTKGKKSSDDGGRDRGDEGPGSKGREPGNKPGTSSKGNDGGKGGSTGGKGGSGGGHGGSGGGHGGSGGGHGGSGGGHGGKGGSTGGSGGGHGGSGGGHGGSGGGHGGH